jgi:hypothetical protein
VYYAWLPSPQQFVIVRSFNICHFQSLWPWWNKESVIIEDVLEIFFTGKMYRIMLERRVGKPRNLATGQILFKTC